MSKVPTQRTSKVPHEFRNAGLRALPVLESLPAITQPGDSWLS